MPDERLSEMFSRYAKGDESTGYGLGLSIVRTIVQSHGGTVILGNRPEGGARATLTFSLKAQEPP